MGSERYGRQVIMPEIGQEGQKKLQNSVVAIVGIGAIGTVAAELLARAGVGTLILVDRDVLEESNLQRQFLFTEKYLGKSKAVVAKEMLKEINSSITIQAHPVHLNSKNVGILQDAHVILDCTDNIQTRMLINWYCKKKQIPWVYAAAIRTEGYVMPILPEGPCFACFLDKKTTETCETAGVLNTITTMVAAVQSSLALKILLGNKVMPLLYHLNSWDVNIKKLTVRKNPDCLSCQGKFVPQEETLTTLRFCSTGRYQLTTDYQKTKTLWKTQEGVSEHNGILQFRMMTLFPDGRLLIKAKTEEEALTFYSQWIGN